MAYISRPLYELTVNGLLIAREKNEVMKRLVEFDRQTYEWEELLLSDPRFKTRVAEARQSLREGQGITLEQFGEKHKAGATKTPKPKKRPTTKK